MSKSMDLRGAAVRYYSDGHTYEQIRLVLGVSLTAVYPWVKIFENRGFV